VSGHSRILVRSALGKRLSGSGRLAGLMLLHAIYASAQDKPASAVRMVVDVHPRSASVVDVMEPGQRAKTRMAIADGFSQAGLSQVDLRWCDETSCALHPDAAHLRLEINLGPLHRGQPRRGIFFEIGAADGRSNEGFQRNLLPVSCRLRTPAGRLLAARDHELHLAAESVSDEGVNSERLGASLADACALVLREQQFVALLPAQQPKLSSGALSGIAIEKRELSVAQPAGTEESGSFSTGSTSKPPRSDQNQAAGSLTPAVAAAEQTKLTRLKDGARTQYILHNQGDTVYFEFGQHDRGQ
jgi:hypothetical protein